MRIKKDTIELINTPKIRVTLALALNRTEQRIIFLLKHNPTNSILTTAAALKIIRQETGLSEKQILMEEKEVSTPKVA